MKKFIQKLKKSLLFLENYSPYFISSQSPIAFKKNWKKSIKNAPKRYLILFVYSLTIWKIVASVKILFKFKGKAIKKRNLILTLFRLIWIENIPPNYYFFHYLKDNQNWEQRHNYLYTSVLSHITNSWTSKKIADLLNNKVSFYQFCNQHNFSTPKNYTFILNNNWDILDNMFPWEKKKDFVLKQVRGSKGIGFILFKYNLDTDTYTTSQDSNLCLAPTLIKNNILSILSKTEQDYIIQEKLENHSLFINLGNEALISVRILSMLDKHQNVKLFRPVLQIPQGSAILNYYHSGALIAPINLKNGQLNTLISPKDTLGTVHPITQIALKTIVVPFWEEIKLEVKRLHSHLNQQPLIGWDIAITNYGFCFLEGNIFPSLDIHQKRPFTPFIGSEFYELFLYHLNKS